MWVDIAGDPLRAWSKNAFWNFLAKWVFVAHMENELSEEGMMSLNSFGIYQITNMDAC